jgi:hypothetical protein
MATRSDVYSAWMPKEILVRVVEEEPNYFSVAAGHRPEAGIYAPSFSLWDGGPLLDLLFQAADASKPKGRPAPVLLVNLFLPKDDSNELPL